MMYEKHVPRTGIHVAYHG